MQNRAIIKQGWLRALIFLVCFLSAIIMIGKITGALFLKAGIDLATSSGADIESNGVNQLYLFLSFIISSLVSVLLVWLFTKFIDRTSFSKLGWEWKTYGYHAATGFFLGPLLLGAGSFILIANKNLNWSDIHFDETEFILNLGMMLIIAISEEIVFRGYLLNNLLQSMNKWLALGISALIFAAFHGSNPGITPVALINLFLGGLVLGVNYIFTRNLWFGILFHFSWNFYQGAVLGYKVSGINLKTVLEQELTGDNLFTGKQFGFEGSVLAGLLCLAATILLAWTYEKKYQTTKLRASSALKDNGEAL